MPGLLLIYAVVVALELVLSLVMLLVLLLTLSPSGVNDDVAAQPETAAPPIERFPDDLVRSLRLAFRELSRGSGDTALLTHTRMMLEREARGEPSGG